MLGINWMFFSHIARNYSTPGVCLCYFWKWFKQCVYSRCGRSEDKCLLCRRWCFPSQHQVSFHVQNYYKHVLSYLPKTWLKKNEDNFTNTENFLPVQLFSCVVCCCCRHRHVVILFVLLWAVQQGHHDRT